MTDFQETKSGTVIVEGVEYNNYPPPPVLLKLMKSRWAKALIKFGNIRLVSLEFYQRWENKVLGDPSDGIALSHMNERPYTIDSHNEIFALCMSLPSISQERALTLAKEGDYDCMVKIVTPEQLFQRIKGAIKRVEGSFWSHCGHVNYDRGQEVDKQTLNTQKFHFNVFQKSPDFEADKEYRLSLTNCDLKSLKTEFIEIEMGNCEDIITIESLPNMRVQGTPLTRGVMLN